MSIVYLYMLKEFSWVSEFRLFADWLPHWMEGRIRTPNLHDSGIKYVECHKQSTV